ncbi:MAG TPA: zinc ribbon domain-containing protein, partial [Thermoleophilia bacterium]|nr:zinc ribbon domain-containing protein [Thermoleophilia bacterium]
MLGRLFGRSKEDNDETICATCGRTLLAGEWTQRLVDDDGRERYVCSLCSRPAEPVDEVGTPAPEVAAVGAGRVKPARADSDVFWRAIKDKDAEIERLESLLARSEAEKQELAAQLASLRGRDGGTPDTALADPVSADVASADPVSADVAPDDATPGDPAPAATAVAAAHDDPAPAAWVDDVGQTMVVPP